MSKLILSDDKEVALKAMMKWTKKKPFPCLTLGGYAGVGKTTLIAVYRERLAKENKKIKVAFVSFTGRATRVLRQRLKKSKVILKQDYVGTIHSLIYSPMVNDNQQITGWKLKEKIEYDLIVIDEASMVDKYLWKDLTSYGVPILAVGDHGQLPPIKGSFNLMEDPQIKLEKIHRQAYDNPIIKVSMLARQNGFIPVRRFSSGVVKIDKTDPESQDQIEELLKNYSKEMMVICGYNQTRVKLNNFIRQHLGFETSEPTRGDRVICLKNNHGKNIYNGMLGSIVSIKSKSKEWYKAEIEMDDEDELFEGFLYKKQFGNQTSINFTKERGKQIRGDLFDFGYALTVHKAQGSQAKKVVVFEERFSRMDEDMWRRWLYTAVTRAENELTIIGR